MIFKADEYPDKGITITASDIARLASTSTTIPISIGHPSVDSPKALVTDQWHPDRNHQRLQIQSVPNYES